jgi:hypothetical protein
MGAKKGQAVVETIFLLPILFAFILIMLQAFYLVHRTQISQKYLKQLAIGLAANRFDLTKLSFTDALTQQKKVFTGAKFSFAVDEFQGSGSKMMAYRFSIPAMLWWVIPKDPGSIRKDFADLEKNGHPGRQAMGFCLGGYDTAQGIKISPSIFNNLAKTAWTCDNN